MKQQMIVFGEDWGKHPSSTQHLIHHLMSDCDIVWVNSLGLRKPRLKWADLARIYNKLSQMLRPTHLNKHVGAAPTIIAPKVIPMASNPLLRKLNSYLLKRSIKPKLSSEQQPILWTSLPSAVDMVGQLNEKLSIYYCGDDFAALEGVDHQQVAAMEQRLVEKVDLILVASETLAAKFPAHKTQILPHGVDYNLFSIQAKKAADLPTHKPVIGFYGSIAGWLDQTLIAQVAQALPQYDFVFIGDIRVDIDTLKGHKNIHFLGPRPHHSLPQYVQHWEASWLPFKACAQIDACNPLKLREYLAAGRPVISTYFPALAEYLDVVHSASNSQQVCQHITQIAEQKRTHNPCIQQQLVINQSWHARAKQLQQFIASMSLKTHQ